MNQVYQLLKLVFTEKKRLVLTFVFTIFVAFFTYTFVNLVQPIMDFYMFKLSPGGIPDKTRFVDVLLNIFGISMDQLVTYLPLILIVVILGKGLFTFLSSFFMNSIGLKVTRGMRNDLFSHLVYQSTDYFDQRSTGELLSRLTNDVDKIQEALSGSAKDMMQELFILFALLVGVFFIDWRLALAAFIITPIALVPLMIFSQKLKRIGMTNQIQMAEIYNLLHEAITGNKIVKAFTMEKFEFKKFLKSTRDYLKVGLKFAWISSMSSPFMEFMGGVVGAFILLVGSNRIANNQISAGDFGAFVMAVFMMYTPIKRLSRANNIIQRAVACHERVLEILNKTPTVKEHKKAYPIPPIKGKIRFDQVSFEYNESGPVLENIDFAIQPSQKAALVGFSGAGKTTIVNLISRFYDPTAGRVLVDGIDIREVTLDSLRSQIGLVTQELILFNDTVRNNIAYGLKNIPMKDIISAAKSAEAHQFIMKLSKGYDTFIGEKGGLLSSGQQQRIAIARALLKDPPILILDEATSALDSKSERLVQRALSNVMKDRTTFIIAHRLSTIRNADMILVLDRGKIIEKGTHDELCRKNGIYKKLYELQFPESREEDF
ncbi:MAG: ATP-binding cassette domain-containing protein [Candidatus Aminicenantes bacterium]|nr:ATP-binding cassette domain-containing protein [Candidatus Aminicenantes bacterium]